MNHYFNTQILHNPSILQPTPVTFLSVPFISSTRRYSKTIAYASRTLNTTAQNYFTIERHISHIKKGQLNTNADAISRIEIYTKEIEVTALQKYIEEFNDRFSKPEPDIASLYNNAPDNLDIEALNEITEQPFNEQSQLFYRNS